MTLPLPDPVSEVKTTLILILAIAVLGTIGYLAYTKLALEKTVAEQQLDISALTTANQDWKAQTDRANSALMALQTEAAIRQKGVEGALADAAKQAAILQKQINDLQNTKPTDPDDCKAAKALADSYLKKVK